jgi:hypothetical protein
MRYDSGTKTTSFVAELRDLTQARGGAESALPRCFAHDGEFVLCKRNRLCYTQPRANEGFAFSSVAQR